MLSVSTRVPGGRICSFSPCMEQVQRTCTAMTEAGFTDIATLECLQRSLDVRTVVLPIADLGYGPAKPAGDPAGNAANLAVDIKLATGHVEIGDVGERSVNATAASKKARRSLKPTDNTSECDDSAGEEGNASDREGDGAKRPWKQQKEQKASYVFKSGIPPLQMNGHTGFLTFATFYPQ